MSAPNPKKKKRGLRKPLFIIILLAIVSALIVRFVLVENGVIMDSGLKYTQEYVVGESNIKGDVDADSFKKLNDDFDIGANKYGYAVFKEPKKAMDRLKRDYGQGIELIREEFDLSPLSCFNYETYGAYGWQVTTGTEEEQDQAAFVSLFVDIYENSFRGTQ